MTNGNFGSRGLSRDPKSLEVSASDRVKVDPTQMIGTTRCPMSASPPKADIAAGRSESPLLPKADLRTAEKREPRPSRWRANPKPRRSYGRSGRPAPRHQHRHAVPVAAIFVAEELDQIPLFELNSDDNVSSRHD